jgi:UDP-N-acetylmuramoyl-L-alanyl-D-glutamate--2,6-diaminopimelate ligase
MWACVSKYSDVVILTQDDDYTEDTHKIIKDVLPGIGRQQWDDFWIVPDRFEAIRTALVTGQKDDVILIAWKGDEHVMITNQWPRKWHDKTVVTKILWELDEHKIVE